MTGLQHILEYSWQFLASISASGHLQVHIDHERVLGEGKIATGNRVCEKRRWGTTDQV